MIYLKHLSVKHRQFGDTEFTVLSGAVKTGCSFSSDKTHIAILSCRLLWIWCGKALLFTWLRDKQSQTSKVPWTQKNILSSLTAGTGIICHTGCLYLETCVLQATADKKKKIFYSSKNTVAPSLWLQSCLDCLTQLFQRSIQTFILQSAFRRSSPVLRVLC